MFSRELTSLVSGCWCNSFYQRNDKDQDIQSCLILLSPINQRIIKFVVSRFHFSRITVNRISNLELQSVLFYIHYLINSIFILETKAVVTQKRGALSFGVHQGDCLYKCLTPSFASLSPNSFTQILFGITVWIIISLGVKK